MAQLAAQRSRDLHSGVDPGIAAGILYPAGPREFLDGLLAADELRRIFSLTGNDLPRRVVDRVVDRIAGGGGGGRPRSPPPAPAAARAVTIRRLASYIKGARRGPRRARDGAAFAAAVAVVRVLDPPRSAPPRPPGASTPRAGVARPPPPPAGADARDVLLGRLAELANMMQRRRWRIKDLAVHARARADRAQPWLGVSELSYLLIQASLRERRPPPEPALVRAAFSALDAVGAGQVPLDAVDAWLAEARRVVHGVEIDAETRALRETWDPFSRRGAGSRAVEDRRAVAGAVLPAVLRRRQLAANVPRPTDPRLLRGESGGRRHQRAAAAPDLAPTTSRPPTSSSRRG